MYFTITANTMRVNIKSSSLADQRPSIDLTDDPRSGYTAFTFSSMFSTESIRRRHKTKSSI